MLLCVVIIIYSTRKICKKGCMTRWSCNMIPVNAIKESPSSYAIQIKQHPKSISVLSVQLTPLSTPPNTVTKTQCPQFAYSPGIISQVVTFPWYGSPRHSIQLQKNSRHAFKFQPVILAETIYQESLSFCSLSVSDLMMKDCISGNEIQIIWEQLWLMWAHAFSLEAWSRKEY